MSGNNENEASSEEMAKTGGGDDDCDHGNSPGDTSDNDSINDCDCDFELNSALRYLAMLSCTRGVLPVDGGLLSVLLATNDVFETLNVNYIREESLCMYEVQKVKAKRVLKDLDGKISLSIDILRCHEGGMYLCLNAHFIDANWKLRKWVINFRNLGWDDHYTASLECLKDWDIGDKVSGITLDSPWYNDEGIGMIKDYVQERGVLPFGSLPFGSYCCADAFKEMAQVALGAISKTLVKVDEYMNFGRAYRAWNDVLDELNEALDFQAEGEWSKPEYVAYRSLSAAEWKKVEGICKLLKSMSHAAKAVFEAKESTANLYLHNIQVVRASLAQESGGSDSFVRPIAEEMLAKLDKYLKDMFLVLAVASVMDPRCKMKYLEYSFSKHGGGNGFLDVTTVLAAVRTIYNGYVTRSAEEEIPMTDSASSNSGDEFSGQPKRKKLNHSDDDSSWIKDYNQFTKDTKTPPKSDLDSYLQDDVLPWTEDFNALNWWRDSSSRYPVLSKMARDILAIPVSMVTSQDAYSVYEREIGKSLASMPANLMNATMCTKTWGLI